MAEHSTRERLITESMRLFGHRATLARRCPTSRRPRGSRPAPGSLYRHFPSKEALLAAGIRRQIDAGQHLLSLLGGGDPVAAMPVRERLITVATAGLRRLEQEADLNRILLKDLARFPELLAIARSDEVARVHAAVAGWLSSQFTLRSGAPADWEALAAVLVGSITNYWMLCDVFGAHPAGISEERYLASLADALVPSLSDIERVSAS